MQINEIRIAIGNGFFFIRSSRLLVGSGVFIERLARMANRKPAPSENCSLCTFFHLKKITATTHSPLRRRVVLYRF